MHMKFRSLIVWLSLLAPCVPAFAEGATYQVTPQWTKENGVTAVAERQGEGNIDFTVTCYLDKAPVENNPGLMTLREAYLLLRDSESKKVILTTRVAEDIENGTLVYRFSLSPETILSAQFSLSKYRGDKDPTNRFSSERFRSDGFSYIVDLSAFALPLLARKQP